MSPCFFNTLNNSLEISPSIVGVIFGAYSITVTSAPKRAYTEPNSKPITPPPITIKCLGTSFNFKASVEVMIRSLSIFIKGRLAGFEPVATMIFIPSITSDEPSFLVIFT